MKKKRHVRLALQALGLLILAVSLTGLSALYYVGHLWSGRRHFTPVAQTQEFLRVAFRPEELFPRQARLTILCLGLDRNWTNQGLPYTRQTRTDSMIVTSLDLLSRRVSTLSLPRDMRVEIPGHGTSKINAAHALGGVPLTVETVSQFLDVPIDYYVLVKIGAVQRLVDAIGGVTLDVEKDMDYDDNWGQLHIHLKKGVQTLDGQQVEGYARFRHDAESDIGRMRRQRQVIQAILARLQSPQIAVRLPSLIDAFGASIETDLSREQILGLAHILHETQPEEVVGETLPGRHLMLNGISYLEPMERRQETLVDWLLRGNETAVHRLTTVRVLNGCGSGQTAWWVARQLEEQEFRVVYAGRAREKTPITRIEGRGRHRLAGEQVAAALEAAGPEWEWAREDPLVTVTVGQDQVARAQEY
jgi:LCP family protein required for cell wall assembly